MTSFDGREKAAENKYTHDAELDFKVNARAHKLLGLWAADQMKMDGDKAHHYAMGVVHTDFAAPDEATVIGRIHADLTASGVSLHLDDIGDELIKCQETAREQVYKLD